MTTGPGRDAAATRGRSAAARALVALPDRAPVLLAALGVAAVLAALVGAFRPWVVLPLAAALGAATWRWVPSWTRHGRAVRAGQAGRADVGGVLALLVLVGGWVVVGLRHAGEYVVVNRDPGFLTLRGLWLSEHPAPGIPVGAAERAAAAVSGASAGTEAFWLGDGLLHAQGNVMLPALLAVQGWVGGERAVLAGGVPVGAVALLALYAAGRRFAGPLWALVPVAGLALSLPFLVGTRSAYTEPLTVAFLCAGLAVAHGALSPGASGARGTPGTRAAAGGRGSRAGAHALVGLLVGAVGAARIDGTVVLVGLAAGYALLALAPTARTGRRVVVRDALVATLCATAMVALGMVDVLLLSPEYVRVHTSQLTALLTVAGAVVVASLLAPRLPARWLRGVRAALLRHRRVLGAGAAGTVLLLGVVLATRPLWWQGRYVDPASGTGYAVTVLQQAAGQPLDAARSYDEQTLAWVAWYLGVPVVVLGFAGLALLARRAVAGRQPAATLLVAVVGVAAVFPLVRASITPDQIWAVRRLLPATFPGLLLAATVALAALAGRPRGGRRRYGSYGGPARAGRSWPGAVRPAVAGVLAAAVVAFPLTTWRPGASVVELSGRATQAHAVCDALDDLGADRVVWTHSSPFRYLATLRVVCDVEVVELLTPPTAADLAAIRDAWGGGTVAALSFDLADHPWSGGVPARGVGGTASTTLGRTLVGVPRTVDTTWSEVWIGLVQDDGTVAPAS